MIESEQKYFETLAQIVKGAEYIEGLPADDRKLADALAKYDRLVQSIQEYRAQSMM